MKGVKKTHESAHTHIKTHDNVHTFALICYV